MTKKLITFYNGPWLTVMLEFKLQDFWIGVYWDVTSGELYNVLEIWICVIPMFPIYIVRVSKNDKS